ncbi:Myb/SANT-like transcription factor [Oryctes borbonicus]|uniref:Myb/SANT-like transcription factor n=1 Tax=Oryctes borbonicus TaxID=1629725 RepID=A0A0T6AW87_9SCAR|nr:Myb/SANT-like transcription factor [Oryctes borbonicus]
MDAEKLICAVKEHPVLYCINHPEYRRTKLKDELWDTIGALFNSEGSIVKEQWQKIRECHREALRRQKKKKTGQKADPPRPWIYQQQMEFLLPFMKNGCPTTKLEPSATDSTDEDESAFPVKETIDEDLDEPPSQNAGAASDETEKIDTNEACTLKRKKKGQETETETIVAHETQPRKKFVTSIPTQQFLGNCEQKANSRDELGQSLLLESKTVQEKDALYQFFVAMYSTTKELPASYQRQIRNRIFEVISQTEEQYESDKSRNLRYPPFFTSRSPQNDDSN